MTVSIADFPVLAANVGERGLKNVEQALAVLNKIITQDGARKVDLTTIKEQLNWGLGRDYDALRDRKAYRDMSQEDRLVSDALPYAPALSAANSTLKKIAKLKVDTEYSRLLIAYFTDIAKLHAIVDPFKNKIIVKEPKVDPVLAYRAPPASKKAQKAVYDLLVKITEDNVEELAQYFNIVSQTRLARFKAKQAEVLAEGEKFSPYTFGIRDNGGRSEVDGSWVELATIAFGAAALHKDDKAAKKVPGADEKVLAQALVDADYQSKVFIFKNMNKMDSILDVKTDFKKAELLKLTGNLLEGSIKVEFKDGSSFVARTQIEHSVSVLGTPYQRYPLRFHDVKLADGTVRSFVPEEEMNTVFVGK